MDYFGSLLDEDESLKWLAKSLKYKPWRLKQQRKQVQQKE